MAEVLSQDEIDALLSAISTGEVNLEEAKSIEEEKKVKVYDFKRPDKLSKDQLRTIQMIHETFARLNTTMLSAQLRSAIQIQVISVDQITYEEFIRSIPEFTILGIFDVGSLEGNAILEMNPNIVYTIIDRLFGGPGEMIDLSRELTDIELTVIERVILKLLNNLKESWSNIIEVSPRIEQIESNPQFVQVVGPNEMVVLVTFEVKIGSVEGMMNICLPYPMIDPIVSKLSAQYWFSSVRKEMTKENLGALKSRLNKVNVPLIANLGKAIVSLNDLLKLKQGDVLKLNQSANKNLDISVGNKLKFKATPGTVGKKMAITIKEVLEEGSD
ncbi:flagellar motor switch protein FliM [Haliovirga abyssi]|uniref:Flagellar motor switch protein FliM n=1 Tax=Haliovirga abyssi TaxID=2996794 RepID=A0AAU9E167_9FUSO|nr:flagellar motor switch protein FliM [Haliovirga abyssi]BDU50115.1 flagellar motor switch protein FliM [Haliovirga abyssi]